VDVGLVGRLANILPLPVLESDGKLDGAIDHRIIVCTLCRDIPTGIRSGESLCADLRSRLAAYHESALADCFTIEGVECMAGCARPLTVAFQAPGKASYLFGSIDAEADAGDLVRFARLYASLADGRCNSGQRPPRLAGKTLARIPGPAKIAGDSR
jgi:predicted metal-binding protein